MKSPSRKQRVEGFVNLETVKSTIFMKATFLFGHELHSNIFVFIKKKEASKHKVHNTVAVIIFIRCSAGKKLNIQIKKKYYSDSIVECFGNDTKLFFMEFKFNSFMLLCKQWSSWCWMEFWCQSWVCIQDQGR